MTLIEKQTNTPVEAVPISVATNSTFCHITLLKLVGLKDLIPLSVRVVLLTLILVGGGAWEKNPYSDCVNVLISPKLSLFITLLLSVTHNAQNIFKCKTKLIAQKTDMIIV